MSYSLCSNRTGKRRVFDVSFLHLPRFLHVLFHSSGVFEMYLAPLCPREFATHKGLLALESQQSILTFQYKDPVSVAWYGSLNIILSPDDRKLCQFDFTMLQNIELLPRKIIDQVHAEGNRERPGMGMPVSPINEYGVSVKLMRFFEFCEGVRYLELLIPRVITTQASPAQCMRDYVAESQSGGGASGNGKDSSDVRQSQKRPRDAGRSSRSSSVDLASGKEVEGSAGKVKATAPAQSLVERSIQRAHHHALLSSTTEARVVSSNERGAQHLAQMKGRRTSADGSVDSTISFG